MRSAAFRTICRILVASMLAFSFTSAQAGLIGVDQVVASSSSAQLDRAAVLNVLGRSEVASQLAALGLDPATAQSRLNAMSDSEVQSLKGQLDTLPAGASDAGVVVAIIVVALVVWYFWFRR